MAEGERLRVWGGCGPLLSPVLPRGSACPEQGRGFRGDHGFAVFLSPQCRWPLEARTLGAGVPIRVGGSKAQFSSAPCGAGKVPTCSSPCLVCTPLRQRLKGNPHSQVSRGAGSAGARASATAPTLACIGGAIQPVLLVDLAPGWGVGSKVPLISPGPGARSPSLLAPVPATPCGASDPKG